VLEEPPATVAEAIEASGLGWSVAKEPIAVDRGDEPDDDCLLPRCEEIPGYYATVRQDTREVLGIVGEQLPHRAKATIRWSCLEVVAGRLARWLLPIAYSPLAASPSRTRM
jgi:hypothetical protein